MSATHSVSSNVNNLNLASVMLIMETTPSSINSVNLEVRHIDGTLYGTFAPEDDFPKKFSKKIVTLDHDNGKFLVHENFKKAVAKKLKAHEESKLPTGAVDFPTENIIIMTVAGKDGDKFLKNLAKKSIPVDEVKHLHFSEGVIFLKDSDDCYAAPYIDVEFPDTINWYVKPTSNKLKYAWVGLSMVEAIDKMHSLVAE